MVNKYGLNQSMYILQGTPGSGKSTVAYALYELFKCSICSTDDYFTVNGVYQFDGSKLKENHRKNLDAAICALSHGETVVIDNCNIKREHAKPYIDAAKSMGVPVIIVRVDGRFNNTHGVPEQTVNRMRQEMEDLTALLV